MRNQPSADIADALTPQPLYGQVRQALVDRIRKGEWMVGDSLPNETFLAQRFGVSVGTVRKAIEGLENHGLVNRIQGRGTYVAGVGSHVLREKFFRIQGTNGLNANIAYELLGLARISLGEDDDLRPHLWTNEDVLEVRQRLHSGGVTLGIETSYLRADFLPNFQRQMSFGQDLYPLLADYGYIATNAKETVSFVQADKDLAELLDLENGSLVMRATRQAFGLDHSKLEYRVSHYRLDRICYEAELN